MKPDLVVCVTAPVNSNFRLKLLWYYSRTVALNRKYFPINFFRPLLSAAVMPYSGIPLKGATSKSMKEPNDLSSLDHTMTFPMDH